MSEVKMTPVMVGAATPRFEQLPNAVKQSQEDNISQTKVEASETTSKALKSAIKQVEGVIQEKLNRTLNFSLIEELNRSVIIVSESGTGNVIRQFPSDEFISVAKHIAQQASELDENALVGILFDRKS
jgi:flagellar protein FlaG